MQELSSISRPDINAVTATSTFPTLVLLPGMHGTADISQWFLRAASPLFRARVISYPSDVPLSYAGLLERISAELAGEQEIVLVAESFSGPMALEYAAARPAQVRAVVLAAAFADSPRPRWLSYLVAPFWFSLPFPAFAVKQFVTGWSVDPSLVREVQRGIARVDPKVLSLRLKEILRAHSLEALTKFTAPILCLAAAHDALVPESAIARMIAIRSDITVRTINASHLLLEAEPVACWKEIEAFLKRIGVLADSGASVDARYR
jgi:pimeloyl-[acyl-carrier protein] methyl ester esterase